MRKLLLNLVAGATMIVVPALAVTLWYTRSHELYRSSLATIQASPIAQAMLGEDIESGLWVRLKTSNKQHSGSAEYTVKGTRGSARAIVSALRQDADWTLRYIWLKPERGKIVVVVDHR